jgi:hypothetical protein
VSCQLNIGRLLKVGPDIYREQKAAGKKNNRKITNCKLPIANFHLKADDMTDLT